MGIHQAMKEENAERSTPNIEHRTQTAAFGVERSVFDVRRFSNDSAVSIQSVSMRFAGKRNGDSIEVLRDISATVVPGEFVCIVGPSGCGKSTLLNIVAGFIRATSGEVIVEGEAVAGPDPRRIFVFQENGVFPWLNVHENIGFGLRRISQAKRNRTIT